MANVEHSSLTGASLHEPKGVAAASANTVYLANGSGSGSWTTVPLAGLSSTAKAFEAQLLHVQDQKAQGTNGGSFTSGSFQTRTLNTVVTNEISGASLASNQITLPAGTYWVEASAPAYRVRENRCQIWNATDGSTILLGTCEYGDRSTTTSVDGEAVEIQVQVRSSVKGRFTLASSKAVSLRHICGTTQTSTGFGVATGQGTEIYSEVCIWKIA